MKRNIKYGTRGLAALAGLALACSAGLTFAQEDYVINAFDNEAETLWARWWGSAIQTYEFDPAVDAATNSNSGALKVTVNFDLAAYGGDNQFAALRNFDGGATQDGTKFTNLVFDIRWDSTSPKNSSGNFGYLEYGFRNSDWSQTWLGGMSVPASPANGWIHVKAPIDPTKPKLATVAGVVLKLWSGGSGGLTGTTVFWLDNVKLIANTNTAPPPPPAMALAKAIPGLQLSASAAGAQYQRQNVRTLATDAEGNPTYYSWVGPTSPVTYSLTIKSFPDAAHSGFQAHLFLVPENVMPYGAGDTSIDWNATNVVFVQIANNANGTASGRFMYKINQGGGNSMLWNTVATNGPVGTLATISDASPLGTWSVTFKTNTEITLTAPSGSSTNFAMPADAAALFADPLYAYFGIQPNNANNIGQSAVLSRVQITGVSTALDENFSGETLDTTKLQVAAADAPGVVQVPPSAAFWLKWGAPATGFTIETSPNLKPGAWADAGLTNTVQVGSDKMVLVPSASLSATTNGFFRLLKP